MPDRIFTIQPDGSLIPLDERDYSSEDVLQQLLARYPDLLAGHAMNPQDPRRWLLIGREFQIPDDEGGSVRWSLDHLFVDQDGTPTLIEVKRSTDARLRREVVGQMLDYASNLTAWVPVEAMQRVFVERCTEERLDPAAEIARLLERPPEDAEEVLWQKVRTKLQAGEVRLVFVADELPRELRRVLEFLNEQMDPAEILGVEVRQYVGQGLQTLVPSVISSRRERKIVRSTPRDTEESFFEKLKAQAGTGPAGIAADLKAWIRPLVSYLWWGRGSMTPTLEIRGGRARGGADCYYFAVRTNGRVEMEFGYLKNKPGFAEEDDLREFIARLNQIAGVSLPPDSFKFPSFPIEVLADDGRRQQFKAAVEWAISRSKAAAGQDGGGVSQNPGGIRP